MDETAVTLKLPRVPPRRRLLGHVPPDVAAVIAAALLLAGVSLTASRAPNGSVATRLASEAPQASPPAAVHRPRSDSGPILASGLASGLASVDADDSADDDEIIIFDDTAEGDEIIIFEEPATPKPRAKRAPIQSRKTARRRARQGRRERKVRRTATATRPKAADLGSANARRRPGK